MAERIDLTTPDQVKPGTASYRVSRLTLDRDQEEVIILLLGENGERKEIVYSEEDGALGMIKALNTADLSVKSLEARIFERLDADGLVSGIVSGTPD